MTNFEKKILWQREVLKLVNSHSMDCQLFGLSYDAITDWQTRLPKKNTSGVINLLMEIAKVVDALNDHSVPRDCPYSETQKELEEMLVLLEQKLKEEV